MAEPLTSTLQPTSENPWYMLATAGKDHADNTHRWNGYMRYLIGDAAAANLRQADGTPIVLPPLTSSEMERIVIKIPLPQKLPSIIPLAELTFAEAANFQDFYFPVFVAFWGSTFGGDATFEKSTFAGEANFTESTFGGDATFEKSTFAGPAYFGGSTFAGEANFNDAKYEGKTSFQKVTFKVAPLFFATTLHEDTNWTEITWPDKPADKDAATEYVRRYDRLALMMSTLKQPDNEHQFFRLSMRAKEVRDGWGISTSVSRFYGLFHYGWGLERALILWVFHILFGAGCLSVMALCQMSQPLPDLAKICTKIVQALAVSFSNGLPFLGLHRGPAKSAYASFDTLTGFDIVWGTQIVSGSLLIFFLLLTIRNRFRFRFR